MVTQYFIIEQTGDKYFRKGRIFRVLNLKSEIKGQIVSKFDLGLLNAYNSMYFDKMRAVGQLVVLVKYSEFYFSSKAANLKYSKITSYKLLSSLI